MPTPETPNLIPLTPAGAPEGVARRAVLQALLGSVGASLAVPALAEAQHPMVGHLATVGAIDQAQANAAVAAYEPIFLDAHQLHTLELLADAIVPGSTAARVAPFLDQLLAVDSAQSQRDFLGALGAFDLAAVQRHSQPWASLSAGEQTAILRDASAAAASKVPLGGPFVNLKTWIVGAYYSSEPGMRELGWTGGVFHAELPGCTHPGGHA
ncbi:MAG: gluconate 2-dehydrogenase subunit 3 family protein [Vicinamibacterales bacterium]